MKITKELFHKSIIAGIFSIVTIGSLSILTFKIELGSFIVSSFGASMVLLFGYPESPFAQPKNVFFGHLITSLVGIIVLKFIPLPEYLTIPLAVGIGIFFMILLNIAHPPAGGNPIFVILTGASFDFLINPIIFGSIIIIIYAILINRFILKKISL